MWWRFVTWKGCIRKIWGRRSMSWKCWSRWMISWRKGVRRSRSWSEKWIIMISWRRRRIIWCSEFFRLRLRFSSWSCRMKSWSESMRSLRRILRRIWLRKSRMRRMIWIAWKVRRKMRFRKGLIDEGRVCLRKSEFLRKRHKSVLRRVSRTKRFCSSERTSFDLSLQISRKSSKGLILGKNEVLWSKESLKSQKWCMRKNFKKWENGRQLL